MLAGPMKMVVDRAATLLFERARSRCVGSKGRFEEDLAITARCGGAWHILAAGDIILFLRGPLTIDEHQEAHSGVTFAPAKLLL